MLKLCLAAASLTVLTGSAFAADPRFCADYSTAAVRQARVAHMTPSCAPGAIGTRWTENYRVHYGWCITAPYGAAERERAMRTRYLRSCRM
jgi:hypothetical protein